MVICFKKLFDKDYITTNAILTNPPSIPHLDHIAICQSPKICYNAKHPKPQTLPIMKTRPTVPTMAWSATHLWKPTLLSLAVLVVSLVFCGLGEAMIVKSGLGAAPWTVLGLGVDNFTPFGFGATIFMISFFVLILWLPLRLKMGLGTVLNAIIIAGSLGVFMPTLPDTDNLIFQILYLLFGVVILGVATCFYLSCQMGGGPRDGLLVGIWQKVDKPIGIVRSAVEITVCAVGFALGGTVGIGTIVFALGVGQVMQITFKLMNDLKKVT